MTSRELQYKALIKEFDAKRMKAEQAQKRREEEVYTKIPDIEALDRKLNCIGADLVRSMITSPDVNRVSNFKQASHELLTTKKMLLVENGFPENYLDVQYSCPICNDLGFVKSKPCKCFKQAQINLAYEQSNIKPLLKIENFRSFNFDYYSPDVDQRFNTSPLNNMKRIYESCVKFVENFEFEPSNLLFYGATGLGKTFLCNCIAKELLDSGHIVLYLTAPQLFKLFEESRFHRDDMEDHAKNLLDILFTVDLLIIDDLGTETGTTFTCSDLFHVLNTRYLNQNATVISTNLKPNEWNDYYSERIASRIFGNYTNLRLFGQDIRVMKKYINSKIHV